MVVAEATYTTPNAILSALQSPEVRYSIRLSLISCAVTTLLSLWVAVPIGYFMSRHPFVGRSLIDAVLDIPIVLPPLVIGLCLLILFQTPLGDVLEDLSRAVTGTLSQWFTGRRVEIGVTYEIPSVILAQFMVACAFAVRTMRVTFDQIHPRCEQVALTLGCNRSQAFWRVVFPQARRGLLAAGTLAWARSLGEFGPILVFAGATRMKTEVLPTTVFLELTTGNIEGAVAASLIMVLAAVIVLIVARIFGLRRIGI
ncbi:MAG: ABC transporter permease [Pirellulales bacterium]|nr:ABC transporter permease [Pirellulales bacterium]